MIDKLLENIKDENGNFKAARLKESYVLKTFPSEFEIINDHSKHIEGLCFSEKLWLYLNNLNEKPKCLNCQGPVKWFSFGQGGYLKTCSNKCRTQCDEFKEKQKQTLFEKYGVTNPSQSKQIQETIKKNNLERYGVENTSQLESIKNRIKKTNNEKYGGNAPIHSNEVKEKTMNTNLEKYGVQHTFQSDEIKKKIVETNLERYGFETPSKNEDVKNKAIEKQRLENLKYYREKYPNFHIKEYKKLTLTVECQKGHDYDIHPAIFRSRVLYYSLENPCTVCQPVETSSLSQKEISDYIRNFDVEIIENDRSIGLELDVYIPSLNVAFEYNGVYWHSEIYKKEDYHINKKKLAYEHGINLIHIWEDDWKTKREIVKSRIEYILKKTSTTIYSRNCEIKEVSQKDYKIFIEQNHIQGYAVAKIIYGLYENNELVSVMSFSEPRRLTGNKKQPDTYEILRFCSKLHTNVIGSSQKLFKHFIKTINPKYVYSYADLCWSSLSNTVYDSLGFKLKKMTVPNFWWVKNGIRYHRFTFAKYKLVESGMGTDDQTEQEIMYQHGYHRVFDCGSNLYTYECQSNQTESI